MKKKIFSACFIPALAAGFSAAHADTITGKVAAMTKNSKETSAEIIPDSVGGQPSHRCSVSTTFQEIGEMLMQAMQSKATVTVVSSKICAADGVVRDCGSVVTLETVQHDAPLSQPRG